MDVIPSIGASKFHTSPTEVYTSHAVGSVGVVKSDQRAKAKTLNRTH